LGIEKLAEYGIAVFAVGGLVATVVTLTNVIKAWADKKYPSGQTPAAPRCSEALGHIIANNTTAMEENTRTNREIQKSNQELQTIIKVFVAEYGTKMDEVLAKVR
jgi:hypothetical protein